MENMIYWLHFKCQGNVGSVPSAACSKVGVSNKVYLLQILKRV